MFAKSEKNPDKNAEWWYKEVLREEKEAAETKVKEEQTQKDKEKNVFTEKGELPQSVVQDKELDGEAAAKKAYDTHNVSETITK